MSEVKPTVSEKPIAEDWALVVEPTQPNRTLVLYKNQPVAGVISAAFADVLFDPSLLNIVATVHKKTDGRFQWHVHPVRILGNSVAGHSFRFYARLSRAGIAVVETPLFASAENALKTFEQLYVHLPAEAFVRYGL